MQLSADTTYCTLTKKSHVFLLNLQEYVRNLLCVYNNSLSMYIICESRCSLKWHNLSLTRWQLSHSSNISASECLMLEINQRNNKRMQNLKGIPIAHPQLLNKPARQKKFPSIFSHETCMMFISVNGFQWGTCQMIFVNLCIGRLPFLHYEDSK